ncbi:MAG: serine O-acetyltransferase EpsC [Lachnospiraceae bacterium]|nr:serine O-acetyltransferase EpsC [Lachnospiraceae bacterium]
MNVQSVGKEVKELLDIVLNDYTKGRDIDAVNFYNKPDKEEIRTLVNQILQIIFPGYFRDSGVKIYNLDSNISVLIEDIFYHLHKQGKKALLFYNAGKSVSDEEIEAESYRICKQFFKQIPVIREYIETDLQAAFDGDPAALCKDEIILAYPGIYATAINRIAHELYLLKMPVIPRIMTEYAHSRTGIDIHPGATIGKYFFIDHGTGIVIGETTNIGDNVKIYQGVTLGALSTKGGQKLSGKKRHPTIENNVTIYAGASVLGGETVVGENTVIGGNAFITKSIPANTRVSIKNQELEYVDYGKGKRIKTSISQSEEWYYVI